MRRLALPWVVGGGILAVLVVAAIYFTGEPHPGGAEAHANQASAEVLEEGKRPEAAHSPAAAAPAAEPVAPIAWRDSPLPPASEDPDAPILLVRVHSLRRLFADLRVVGKEAGMSKQIESLFALLAVSGGESGLPGIDADEPWGAYAHFPPGASHREIVGVVPVRDEAEFLKLLASLYCPADRDGTGLYVVRSQHLPAPVRFRFADGHAYGTFDDPAALDDGKRIAPGRLFARQIDEDMVVTARADRLPAPMREAILSQIDGVPELVRGQMAGMSGTRQAWARKLTESVSTLARDVFEGKAELTLRLGVDQAAREIVADLHLRGAPGSRLAGNLSALAPGPSRFGGVIAGNPALAALVHVQLPDDYRRLLAGLAREATQQVVRDQGPNFGKEHERLFKLVEDAVEAGELDVATAVRSHGPGKPGSLFGLKVPDGEALDQLYRDLFAKEAAPEDRALFRFNADDLPGAKVHRYETAALARDMPRFAPLLGGGPSLIGFSKDALWLAGGTDGRDTLRVALDDPSRPAPIFHFEVNTKALAELVSSFSPGAAKFDDVIATLTDEQPGRVRLTLEGGADLHLRGSLDLALLGLGARLVKIQGQLEGQSAKP